MLEPKWVIAMGACASLGGMFNNYATLQGVDKVVPVDVYVPGCPPRPEQLIEGIVRLHEEVLRGRAAGVRAAERRVVSEARRLAFPGWRGASTASETTLVVDPARLVDACTHLRDERRFQLPSDLSAVDYLAGARRTSPATGRGRGGRP